jgi:hypothetical protein
MPRTDYPAMELFLGLYLETLMENVADDWEALRTFLRDEDECGPLLTHEIRQVLSTGPSEEDLEVFFDETLRTDADPRIIGYGFAEWLLEVLRVIDDPSYTPATRPISE